MSRMAPQESERAGDRILTIPNVLSLLRLMTVPVFLWLFTNDRENAAVIVYGAGAWTDFFDGAIARRFNQVSEFGKLLDPLSDRVYIVSMVIALVVRDTLPLWLAAILLARDALVLGMFPLLEKRGAPRLRVNFTGKSATAALFFGLTWLMWSETTFPLASVGTEIGFPFVGLGAVLYWVAAMMYAKEGMAALKTTAAVVGDEGAQVE